MEDPELLAAIGQVVVNAAWLEYSVAVLVAAIEGHRDGDCEDRAVAIVKKSGRAMRELRKLASAQLRGQGMSPQQIVRMLTISKGRAVSVKAVLDDLNSWDREHADAAPRTECYLIPLWRDAAAVLGDRHVIAHSIAMEDVEADGQAGLVIFHPGSGAETTLTTSAVMSHAQDIRIAFRRFHHAIAAETR